MTFHYDYYSNNTSYGFQSKIMVSAILSLSFVIVIVLLLHIYARCKLRRPPGDLHVTSPVLIHTNQSPVPTKRGLDAMVINSLPSFRFKQLDSQDQEECTVCLSVLENDDFVRRLPNCNHVFHMDCIDTWLQGQSTCPVCRSEATPRLALLDREPPRVADHTDMVVAVLDTTNPREQGEQSVINKGISNGNGNGASSSSSSSSSFRLSSFRKIIGRELSFTSRRTQVNTEHDLERQDQLLQ